MQVNCRRAAAGHGRGDFLGDDSRFADAEQDDFAFARGEYPDNAVNLVAAKPRRSLSNRIRLNA